MNEFDFRDDAETVYTSDPYYDLFDGGYIKPSELLADDEQVKAVTEAIEVVRTFIEEAFGNGVLEET